VDFQIDGIFWLDGRVDSDLISFWISSKVV
jgi:hypothetical protein